MYLVDSSKIQGVTGQRLPSYLGNGVFETMRVRQGEAGQWIIPGFLLHCERLITGAKALGLFVPAVEALEEAVLSELSSCTRGEDLVLRFVADTDQVLVFAEKYLPHPWVTSGVSLKTVAMTRPLPEYKHGSALVSIESDRQAKTAGFDTALLYEPDGLFTECSWANFYWVSLDGDICSNLKGVLPGVTQTLLSAFVSVTHRPLTLSAIAAGQCQAAFISQASSGVVSVIKIDSIQFAKDKILGCEELLAPFKQALKTSELPGTLLLGTLASS